MERCGEDSVLGRGGEVVKNVGYGEDHGEVMGRWGRTGEQEMIAGKGNRTPSRKAKTKRAEQATGERD